MKEENKKYFVECECGAKVYGISLLQAQSNLVPHRKSKRHKELMEITKGKTKWPSLELN